MFAAQLEKNVYVLRPIPVKALPNGEAEPIDGMLRALPLSGSPTSAFNQVTPFLCCFVLVR